MIIGLSVFRQRTSLALHDSQQWVLNFLNSRIKLREVHAIPIFCPVSEQSRCFLHLIVGNDPHLIHLACKPWVSKQIELVFTIVFETAFQTLNS